ncbi:MAG: FAD binding domain-containing protein [Spirochaetia bacterium]
MQKNISPGMTVLDALRKEIGLKGTKEGCREGECGACTVLLGELRNGRVSYKAVPSCMLPVGEAECKHVVTIEGLNLSELNPVQKAFADMNASQCGFCTPGFILAFTGYLLSGRELTLEDAMTSVDGNICRCTGYASIRRAITTLFQDYRLEGKIPDIAFLTENRFLPEYFLQSSQLLSAIQTERCEYPAKGTLVAGGTDLYIQKGEVLPDEEVRFLSAEDGVTGISEVQDEIIIGAGATVEEFRLDPLLNKHFPGLDEKLLLISSTILRNRATIGGNIVNASPIGDMSVLLLALEARLLLAGKNGESYLPLEDFFLGYKELALKPGEMIKSIIIPIPEFQVFWNFEKVSKRERLDIATCNSGVTITVQNGKIRNIRLSFGGVAPVPLLVKQTQEFLKNKDLDIRVLKAAQDILAEEIAPISDVRGSSEYKTDLAKRLLHAHLESCFPDQIVYPLDGRGRMS